jgi:hypothetical protein
MSRIALKHTNQREVHAHTTSRHNMKQARMPGTKSLSLALRYSLITPATGSQDIMSASRHLSATS